MGEQQQHVQTNQERPNGQLAGRVRSLQESLRTAWATWPRPRLIAAGAVLVVLLVVAVSCLGGSDGRADVPVQSDGADAGITAVRAPSDGTGGTLRVVAGDIDSLDPQRSYSPGVWNLMRLYARTLVTYSTQPGSTGTLVPDLATDLGTTDDDGLTWTFTLREGARFENGEPITAQDVKYGIARSFAAEEITGGPTHIIDALENPNNVYPGPYRLQEGDPKLDAVQTPSDRTIVFKLRRAMPEFPHILALPSSSPVPKALDTRKDYGADPVSSGPYAVTSVDDHAVVLERNPEWDRASDPVRTALPDRVLVRTGLSGLERDQALLAGSADVDISATGVQAPTTARIAADDGGELAGRVDTITTGAVRMLAMPTKVAPLTEAPCRAAVAAVVDRRAVQEILGGGSSAVRTSQLWPRAMGGGPDEPDPEPDLDAARAALEECGQPDGFATTMAVLDVPTNVAVARDIAGQLAQVGIDVTVEPLAPETFYVTDVGKPANVTAKGYGLVLVTWTADMPIPAFFLGPLVDGRSIEEEAGNTNYAVLRWKRLDATIDAARKAAAAGAGDEGWRKVAELARGTEAYVPLTEARAQLVAGQRLRNGVVMEPYGSYDLATAGIR